MKTNVGLWVDHKKAIIMVVTGQDEEIGLILSKVEKQARRSQGSRHEGPFESQKVPADDSRQRSRTAHLNIFYDAIVASLSAADSILIFGPGEAKDQLHKRLEKAGMGGRVLAVETVDSMTKHQIAAKVRSRFA